MRKKPLVPILQKACRNKSSVPHKKLPAGERLVLVYAGLRTAFRVCEFDNWDIMARFIARNKITGDEFMVLRGTIVSVTEAYRDRRNHPIDMIAMDVLEDMNAETQMADPEASPGDT
jgi:hypothetical protein